jgi:8-oxo-dGTP pyrophosphatase MutT (NUDIX family)
VTLHDDAVRVLGTFPAGAEAVRQRFVDLLARGPATVRREHTAGHLTASALVVDASAQRVLLCLHGRIGRWVQLGGHCEPVDPTVAAAALREATEESGIEGLVLSPAPIHLDIHPVTCSAGPSVHYDVRYAALAPAGAVEQVSAESRALGWFAPDALPEPLAGGVRPLIEPALAWAAQVRRSAGAQSAAPAAGIPSPEARVTAAEDRS